MKVLVCLLMAIGFSVHAAKPSASPKMPAAKYNQKLIELSPYTETGMVKVSDEVVMAAQKAKKSQRAPANANNLSPEFAGIRDRFLQVKTDSELDALLAKLDADYNKLTNNDSKLFAAQVVVARSLRSMVWRLIPLAGKAKITHSAVLTVVKQMASGVTTFLPTEQWRVGMDYINYPHAVNNKVISQFSDEATLQAYLANTVLPALKTAADRIAAIDLSRSPAVWDNQILYGVASFKDDLDRYRWVGDVEQFLVIAGLRMSIAQIEFGRAYSAQGTLELSNQIGNIYGFDVIGSNFGNTINGAPARDRVAVIRNGQFNEWGKRVDDWKTWTEDSLKQSREAVRLLSSAWKAIKNRSDNDFWSIDPVFVRSAELLRTGELRIHDVEAAFAGRTKIRSAVTGDTVTIDLPAFFSAPPEDLKALYPTQFNEEKEWKLIEVPADNQIKKVAARNYLSGSPINWNIQAFKTFLPEITKGDDVKVAARVLAQSFGGSAALAPMLQFIN